jgi:hypothetical protein
VPGADDVASVVREHTAAIVERLARASLRR